MSLLYQKGGINVNFTLEIKIKKCFFSSMKEYFLIKIIINKSLSTTQLWKQGITIKFNINFILINFQSEIFHL